MEQVKKALNSSEKMEIGSHVEERAQALVAREYIQVTTGTTKGQFNNGASSVSPLE